MTRLALFDLDHTLLPLDSDHAWGTFLVSIGAVDADRYLEKNRQFYSDYKAGTLDIFAFLQFSLAPLAAHSRSQLDQWHGQFMKEIIEPALHSGALALVKKHQARGDLCCIVTATNSFIARPIARVFGVDHLIATEPATVDHPQSNFTGAVAGVPSFREGKIVRTQHWLATLGFDWHSFEESYFYSDSINDLPLLEKVSHPVVTNPDPRLRAIAQANQWPILELF
ncbi:MAG: HAD family hydrolase [Ottowia sp.]|nr:HAD family hydrolase [Ottowia sp.]